MKIVIATIVLMTIATAAYTWTFRPSYYGECSYEQSNAWDAGYAAGKREGREEMRDEIVSEISYKY